MYSSKAMRGRKFCEVKLGIDNTRRVVRKCFEPGGEEPGKERKMTH